MNYLAKTFLNLTGVSLCLLITGEVASAIVVSGDPSGGNSTFGSSFDRNDPYYIVNPGESDPISGISLDGVADLAINTNSGNFRCTGSRIGSNLVLTAAHCVTDANGILDANSVTATWELSGGNNVNATSQNITFHPNWDGSLGNGYDVAVIETNAISSSVPTYTLYGGSNELGVQFTKVGYGRSGNGNNGDTISSGTKRQGQNIYDDFSLDGGGNSGIVEFDFDNGSQPNNAFFGSDTGIGFEEINSAPGDSGGPSFIDGLIAGVTSFGRGSITDVDFPTINSTFGEISGDARVSAYRSFFVDNFGNEVSFDDPTPVPFGVNKSLGFFLVGGMLVGRQFLKHRKRQ